MLKEQAAASPVADPIEETPAAPAVEASDDAKAADPSPAEPEDAKERSLLDVVKAAVKDDPAAVASSDPESDPAAPKVEVEARPEGAEAEAKPDSEADVPFHNHPRWKELLAERDSYRDGAERFEAIDKFREEHNLSPEQIAEGYEVMALLASRDHGSLAKAREWFSARLSYLDEALGNVLPADLQQKVEDGWLDEEGAMEVARTRAADKLRTEAEQRNAEAATAAEARTNEVATYNSIVSAVSGWEERTKASDPDYSMKSDLVMAKVQAIAMREGPPQTAEKAVALADRALAEVNQMFASKLPKPRPVQADPVGNHAPVASQPNSLREAIAAAVN